MKQMNEVMLLLRLMILLNNRRTATLLTLFFNLKGLVYNQSRHQEMKVLPKQAQTIQLKA